MAKICKSCGKEYTGDWCEHCGWGNPDIKIKASKKYKKNTTPVRFMTEEQKAEYFAEEEKKHGGKRKISQKLLKILTAAVCVALVVVIILFILLKKGILFGDEDVEEVAESYFQSINDRDFEEILSCVPPAIKEAYEDEIEEMDIAEGEEIETLYSDFFETYGDDFKFDITIGTKSEVDDDTISDYEDSYKDIYGDNINVREAYCYDITAQISGSTSSATVYYEVYIAKFSGHWYMVDAAVVTPSISADEETTEE